ncbi:MAG: motility protein A [Candidatus Marinimicrobia bacterium]|nr:motility protein A [Candidatus Neomarinimicrobiota bacterium]
MDLATILGIIAGLGLVFYSITSGGDLTTFIHVPSMLIVFGGTFAAILVNFPMSEIISVMSVVRKAFSDDRRKAISLVHQFVELSKKSRKEGLLSIDKELNKIGDEYMRNGLEMVVDGMDQDTIRDIMETELTYLIERHKKGQQIFTSLGTFSPAFGMIGTLIGLILMLRKLEDPTAIGGGMALALITTFYGVLAANLVFLPIAGKLKNRSDDEVIIKEMIIEGVLAIQNGEHPRILYKKLLNYLPPKMRIESTKEEQ